MPCPVYTLCLYNGVAIYRALDHTQYKSPYAWAAKPCREYFHFGSMYCMVVVAWKGFFLSSCWFGGSFFSVVVFFF